MENQISLTSSNLALVNALEKGDKLEIVRALNVFKTDTGLIKYDALLLIPQKKRLAAMYDHNPKRATTLVVVALTHAFQSMNLTRPMTAGQMLDLAEAIFDTSTEDQLSLQDVMLFLQGLTRGKYGPLYESMDIPKFMAKFEMYRQERHVEYLRIKETKHLEYKAMGPSERSAATDPLSEAAYNMMGRMGELKAKLKEQRDFNKTVKWD